MEVKNSQDVTSGNYPLKNYLFRKYHMSVFFHLITGMAIFAGLVMILLLKSSLSDEALSGENQRPLFNSLEKENGEKVELDI